MPTSNSNFNGTVNFADSKFNGTANFRARSSTAMLASGLEVQRRCRLRGLEVQRRCRLRDSKFNGTANFRDSKFNDTANFRSSTFNNSDFSEAQFSKTVSFDDARFSNSTSFNSSRFKDDALFEGAVFDGTLYLTRAKYDRLYIRWKNIKELGYDDAAYLALQENFKKLGYLEDYDGCYYEYRKAHRDQDWGGKYHSMNWAEEGLRKYIFDFLLEIFYGYGKKPIWPLAWSALTILSLRALLALGWTENR